MGGIDADGDLGAINPSAKVILSSGHFQQSRSEATPIMFLPVPYGIDTLREVFACELQSA